MATCKDCGLLSVQTTSRDAIREADSTVRTSGIVPATYCITPHCAIGEFQLNDEYNAKHDGARNGERTYLMVIETERDCKSHILYRPTFSPKEHMEFYYRELDQKRHEERMNADRERAATLAREMKEEERRWQAEQKEAEREWQVSQKKSDRDWQWNLAIRTTILTFVVGGFGAVIGFILKGYFEGKPKGESPTTELVAGQPKQQDLKPMPPAISP